MPNCIKIDYPEILKEIEIYRMNHHAMQPFIIMNRDTLNFLAKDFDAPITTTSTVAKLMGINVAVCESLSFGEFKVR